jgi:hypothetical protein
MKEILKDGILEESRVVLRSLWLNFVLLIMLTNILMPLDWYWLRFMFFFITKKLS